MNQVAPPLGDRSHRRDIQGLRAFAVVAVIAFHAGLPVPGGFVGVDVFFVISGFVITAMLMRQHATNGRISLRNFWARRFLRLTPALAFLVTLVIIISLIILFPNGQKLTVQTGLGAIFLISNIVIARTTGGYFDESADLNPLLNTWSLSVEEQFYVLFPFVIAASFLIRMRLKGAFHAPAVAVFGIAIISFGLALFGLSGWANQAGLTFLNFYSPFVRAWEFAVGALLALLIARAPLLGRSLNQLFSLLGATGLVLACFIITPSTPFPGVWTLLPVVSTGLLIYTGTDNSSVFNNALGLKPATIVGDWSYSLYLWHWPAVSFAIALGFRDMRSLLIAVMVSIPVALASFYGVERPIRSLRNVSAPKLVGLALGVVAVPVSAAVFALAIYETPSLHEGNTGVGYLDYIAQNSYPCTIPQTGEALSRCRQSKEGEPITVALIGDSHAEHLYPGLVDLVPSQNIAYAYLPEWPLDSTENSTLTLLNISESKTIDTVILASKWNPVGALKDELGSVIQQLTDANKRVFVANDGPYFSFTADMCKYQRPFGLRQQCFESSDVFDASYSRYEPALLAQINVGNNVHIIDTAGGICTDGKCSMLDGDRILYADQGHLNVTGSRFVVERLLKTDSKLAGALR